jgi:peptidoglycan/LPS O-acetylase OafA/YrhL
MSYSLYLWHYPVTWTIRGGDMHAHSNIASTGLAIGLSVGLAVGSYHLVERRFRRPTSPRIVSRSLTLSATAERRPAVDGHPPRSNDSSSE